jgi:hypothetical protein
MRTLKNTDDLFNRTKWLVHCKRSRTFKVTFNILRLAALDFFNVNEGPARDPYFTTCRYGGKPSRGAARSWMSSQPTWGCIY